MQTDLITFMEQHLSQSNQSALASLSQSELVLLADEDGARSVCGSWINSPSDLLRRPAAVFLLSSSGLAVLLLSLCLCFDSVLLPQSHFYSAPDADRRPRGAAHAGLVCPG